MISRARRNVKSCGSLQASKESAEVLEPVQTSTAGPSKYIQNRRSQEKFPCSATDWPPFFPGPGTQAQQNEGASSAGYTALCASWENNAFLRNAFNVTSPSLYESASLCPTANSLGLL